MRQKWIDALRDRVAEIVSTAHWFYVSGRASSTADVDGEALETESLQVERKLLFLMWQVELMLNPKEEDHIALLRSLKDTRRTIWPEGGSVTEFPDAVEHTIDVCQKVLKREWERVKHED